MGSQTVSEHQQKETGSIDVKVVDLEEKKEASGYG